MALLSRKQVYSQSFYKYLTSYFQPDLHDIVREAAEAGNERASHLLRNGFDQYYAENLARVVIYYNEFNYEEIFETPVYTVSLATSTSMEPEL